MVKVNVNTPAFVKIGEVNESVTAIGHFVAPTTNVDITITAFGYKTVQQTLLRYLIN